MHIPRLNVVNPFVFARRAAGLAVFAGVATLGLQAEQPVVAPSQPAVPFSSYLNAATPASFNISSSSDADLAYSSSTGAAETVAAQSFMATTDATQPPPRRRYGRPRYADGSHNADGSNKFAFQAGAGMTLPTQDTKVVNKQSWAFQVGAGRNFNKKFSVLAQFDWDNMGLQGTNLYNQTNLYNSFCTIALQNAGVCSPISGLDGNSHVWSFTVNPSYNFYSGEGLGAYVVGGVGFYHKVTTFTVPATGEYCDYYGYCYEYSANAIYDHYTSNSPGMNGGLGLTFKPSRFANEKFFIEARYVYVFNSAKQGLTPANVNTAYGQAYTGTNFYPANSQRTSYVPVKVGIRF